MENTEVALRVAKHISDLGGIKMSFDDPIGIMIVELNNGGFGAFVDCSDTFDYACADSEIITTEEELDLFLECSRIFVKKYTGKDIENHYNTLFSDEEEDEYCYWVTKMYCSRVRGQRLLQPYYDEMPEWLKEHFPSIKECRLINNI